MVSCEEVCIIHQILRRAASSNIVLKLLSVVTAGIAPDTVRTLQFNRCLFNISKMLIRDGSRFILNMPKILERWQDNNQVSLPVHKELATTSVFPDIVKVASSLCRVGDALLRGPRSDLQRNVIGPHVCLGRVIRSYGTSIPSIGDSQPSRDGNVNTPGLHLRLSLCWSQTGYGLYSAKSICYIISYWIIIVVC